MNSSTGLIRSESHVEIGSLIESSADIILEQWCYRAIEEQPTAKRAHATVLRDHFGRLLRAIGRALREPGDTGVHRSPALLHGEQRWETGWSLSEVVRDYQLLRLVILACLERMLARELYYRESMAIGVFIDDAIAESVAAYVSQREDEAVRGERERALLAEEASRRKDEFLAVLGHELRNPLAPIVTSVRVIRSVIGATPDAVRQCVEVIERQAAQMSRLVDDMLDLARIGQGRFELRLSRLVLARLIEQAVLGAQPVMKAKRHVLTVSMPDSALELDADADRLLQVIGNLLNNAAKYTPAGGEIVLAAAQDGRDAVIRVRDNGIGIPAGMLSRVFELFAQVDGAKEHAQGGLGIGLTLVRRLVEEHGGSISCHSDGPGTGSEFIVRLPLAGRAHAPSFSDGLGGETAIRIVRRKP